MTVRQAGRARFLAQRLIGSDDAPPRWQEPPVWLPRVATGLIPTGVRCDSIRSPRGATKRTRLESARVNMATIVAACVSTEWVCDDFVLSWASDGSWASAFQGAECLLSGAIRSVVQYCARCRLWGRALPFRVVPTFAQSCRLTSGRFPPRSACGYECLPAGVWG